MTWKIAEVAAAAPTPMLEVAEMVACRVIDNAGVALGGQGVKYTGIYPSLGPGEILKDKVNWLVIGHGLFSLIDEFPFQHPDAPELNVSIPVANRSFGQGASAVFDSFRVIIAEPR